MTIFDGSNALIPRNFGDLDRVLPVGISHEMSLRLDVTLMPSPSFFWAHLDVRVSGYRLQH